MQEELKNLKAAVDGLVLVARAMHVPFDTSQVEKCIKAVEKASGVKADVPKVENK